MYDIAAMQGPAIKHKYSCGSQIRRKKYNHLLETPIIREPGSRTTAQIHQQAPGSDTYADDTAILWRQT